MVPQALHQLRERTPTILCFIFTFLQYFYYSIQIAYVLFRTVLTLHSLYRVIIHPQHRLPLLTMMFLPQPESWDYGHGPSYLVKFLKVFLVTCYYICEYLPLTTHLTEETQDEKNLILARASQDLRPTCQQSMAEQPIHDSWYQWQRQLTAYQTKSKKGKKAYAGPWLAASSLPLAYLVSPDSEGMRWFHLAQGRSLPTSSSSLWMSSHAYSKAHTKLLWNSESKVTLLLTCFDLIPFILHFPLCYCCPIFYIYIYKPHKTRLLLFVLKKYSNSLRIS